MSEYIKLSPQDRAVLNVLWENGKMTNTEVLNKLGTEDWTRHTVRAYLLRLIEKNLVDVEKVSRKQQYYYSVVTKEDFIAGETSAYLNERYDSLAHMVAGLALGKQVTNDELDELEKFLHEFKQKDK